jgi:hypothetical protein
LLADRHHIARAARLCTIIRPSFHKLPPAGQHVTTAISLLGRVADDVRQRGLD